MSNNFNFINFINNLSTRIYPYIYKWYHVKVSNIYGLSTEKNIRFGNKNFVFLLATELNLI